MFIQAKGTGDLLVTAGLPILNAFTLFSINQRVIDTVGYFDETISPGYAYFEDNDFGRRINLAGLKRVDVLTSAFHVGSGTIKAMSAQEQADHSRKFSIAQDNYVKKWGGRPAYEVYTTPYNRGGNFYSPHTDYPMTRVK